MTYVSTHTLFLVSLLKPSLLVLVINKWTFLLRHTEKSPSEMELSIVLPLFKGNVVES